jgi:glucose/mannose transport system substrate-binding protein
LTRRAHLQWLAGFGAFAAGSVALTACGVSQPTLAPTAAPPAPAPTVAPAPPTAAPAAVAPTSPPAKAAGKLEIFSWWTNPGEAEALDALYQIYKKMYPDVQIVNAAISGGAGAGGNLKAVLKTRVLGGDPPESFQAHFGLEITDTWAKGGYLEPLDDLYKSEGYASVYPKDLVDIVSWDGHPWSVVPNIHRGNVLWYDKAALSKQGIEPPATFADYFQAAGKLKDTKLPALALGEASAGMAGSVCETVLIGTLGVEGYRGLWNGKTPWTDAKVTEALTNMAHMLDSVNPDYLSINWGDTGELLVSSKAAMLINGDWQYGFFKAKKYADQIGWIPTPNTKGVYDVAGDSFALPKGAKNRVNAVNWLKVVGSLEGQEAFNPLKGSIPARTDGGKSSGYDAYQKQAMEEFKKDTLVPTAAQGSAAKESWVTDYYNIINYLATKKDVAGTQKRLIQACLDAGVCK